MLLPPFTLRQPVCLSISFSFSVSSPSFTHIHAQTSVPWFLLRENCLSQCSSCSQSSILESNLSFSCTQEDLNSSLLANSVHFCFFTCKMENLNSFPKWWLLNEIVNVRVLDLIISAQKLQFPFYCGSTFSRAHLPVLWWFAASNTYVCFRISHSIFF